MPIAALWPLPPVVTFASNRKARPLPGKDDFLAAIQGLLPSGRAWPRDPDTVMTAVLDGWARAYNRVNARQANLLIDAFPLSTVELLPEWEATLGLPDPCLGPAPTVQQRQAQVLSRFTDPGGQSIGRLTAVAASLGYTVAITEYAPFRAGISRCGDAITGTIYFVTGVVHVAIVNLNSLSWSHALKVTALKEPTRLFLTGHSASGDPLADWSGTAIAPIVPFRAGTGRSGDPLESWGAAVLECELRRIAPAQSALIFAYSA
jgi:uncharacterized protein YmfQ (DUF2313 family)